jgi:hypothetical protein
LGHNQQGFVPCVDDQRTYDWCDKRVALMDAECVDQATFIDELVMTVEQFVRLVVGDKLKGGAYFGSKAYGCRRPASDIDYVLFFFAMPRLAYPFANCSETSATCSKPQPLGVSCALN